MNKLKMYYVEFEDAWEGNQVDLQKNMLWVSKDIVDGDCIPKADTLEEFIFVLFGEDPAEGHYTEGSNGFYILEYTKRAAARSLRKSLRYEDEVESMVAYEMSRD